MLINQIFIETCRSELMALTGTIAVPEITEHTQFDRHIAASLLQKAIRRDELGHAWNAASHLLENSPPVLWKRLAVIALEDVGAANIPLVMQVLMASSISHLRQQLGGSRSVAFALIQAMCNSPKDRSTDDLFDVLSRDPKIAERKANLAELETKDSESAPYPPGEGVVAASLHIALAANALSSTDAYVTGRKRWALAISDLPEDVVSPGVKETALLGLRSTGLILAPLLCAIAPFTPKRQNYFDDEFMTAKIVEQIPTWALGQHVRIGLDGFRRFARRSSRTKAILAQAATGKVSIPKTIGGLVFRLECGQLRNRLDWQIGRDLKSKATSLGWGIQDDAVPSMLAILMEEWDLLNDCRCEALADYLR